jgi:predicted O-methyltransferase YrrM
MAVLDTLIPIANEVGRLAFSVIGSSGQLTRMQELEDKAGASLAGAFDATLSYTVSEVEKRYISQIETLRSQMEESSQDVEIVDFGAGSGSNPKPGRVLHASLSRICRAASRRPISGLLMMKLIQAFQPNTVIELGTSVGISAMYQAAGLEINNRGKIITLEGAPAVATIAEANLSQIGLSERAEVVVGRFKDTLPNVLERSRPIEFAFIDGHHDFAATLEYFEQIKPSLSTSAVLVFDDISWSSGMATAWKKIVADPRVGLVVDIFSMGLCILNGQKRSFRVALPRS